MYLFVLRLGSLGGFVSFLASGAAHQHRLADQPALGVRSGVGHDASVRRVRLVR